MQYISLEKASRLSRIWSGDDYAAMLKDDQEKENEPVKEDGKEDGPVEAEEEDMPDDWDGMDDEEF